MALKITIFIDLNIPAMHKSDSSSSYSKIINNVPRQDGQPQRLFVLKYRSYILAPVVGRHGEVYARINSQPPQGP